MNDVELYKSIGNRIKRLCKIQKRLIKKHTIYLGCRYEVDGECQLLCMHDCKAGAITKIDEVFKTAGIY